MKFSPFSYYPTFTEMLFVQSYSWRQTDTEGYDSISISHTQSLDSSIQKAWNQRLSAFWHFLDFRSLAKTNYKIYKFNNSRHLLTVSVPKQGLKTNSELARLSGEQS